MSNEIVTLAIGQSVIMFGMILKVVWDWLVRIEDRKDREQDRLDREQLAKLNLDQLEAIQNKGAERLKTIVKEVKEVKQVAIAGIKASKNAIDVANGHNEKIVTAVELSQQVLAKLDSPLETKIVNDKQHPVPTQITK